jgi:hypothetical protein
VDDGAYAASASAYDAAHGAEIVEADPYVDGVAGEWKREIKRIRQRRAGRQAHDTRTPYTVAPLFVDVHASLLGTERVKQAPQVRAFAG